jgi:penicillin-binding protein 1C
MRGTSGITGAAPLFHAAMDAAMRGKDARPLRLAERGDRGDELEAVEVCPLSGGRPTAACPHAIREWMTRSAREALPSCSAHVAVRIDRRNGLRAGPACAASFVEERVFERYDGAMRTWADAAGRPEPPDAYSPLCPGRSRDPGMLRIGWPADGARFVIDPDRPRALQQLSVRIDAPAEVQQVEIVVDGRTVARVPAPFVARWPLSSGRHVLVARADGAQSPPVAFAVE